MSFTYTSTIPAANNDPADDQPLMLQNFGSISSLIDIDHIGFNTASGGIHKQVNFQNQSSPSLTGDSLLYSNGDEVYFKNASQDTILTGTAPTVSQNGSVFLPGGLLLQWGRDSIASGGTTKAVSFTNNFTSACYSVVITPYNNPITGNSPREIGIQDASIAVSGFTAENFNGVTPSTVNFGWIAIGS